MFEIRKDAFYLHGKKFRLFSGAMHYFRVPREYWVDRLAKMKACGFNCVETVTPWNFHEIKRGEFDFSGMRDIAAYCRAAAKHGLYVIIRPGPYICAEWDFGQRSRLSCGGGDIHRRPYEGDSAAAGDARRQPACLADRE